MQTIAVITVCLNSVKSISKTFDSILAQTTPPDEYIVIDGYSTDGTINIIKQYSSKFEQCGIPFHWVSEPDNGIYNAMNKGILMTKSDIIGILNSDDTYKPDCIKIIHEECNEHPTIDVYHGVLRFHRCGKTVMIQGNSSTMLNECMIQHPTCFVRKRVYKTAGLFDESYRFVADYDFMLRLKNEDYKFLFIEKLLADFSMEGASNSYDARIELFKLQRKWKLVHPIKLVYRRLQLEYEFKSRK